MSNDTLRMGGPVGVNFLKINNLGSPPKCLRGSLSISSHLDNVRFMFGANRKYLVRFSWLILQIYD